MPISPVSIFQPVYKYLMTNANVRHEGAIDKGFCNSSLVRYTGDLKYPEPDTEIKVRI